MKKINWKILNLALWTEVLLSYVLPFKVIDNFQYQVGFPMPFLSVYNTGIRVNPLMSMSLNLVALLFDAVILYLAISFLTEAYKKRGRRHTN